MFCPKCGNANQTENSYCRNCGVFLPDFDKLKNKETPPEQHFIVNSTLNALSCLGSLGLAVFLYLFYVGREGTPIFMYVILGFLTANFFWQAQIFWRTLQLKKQFPKRRNETEEESQPAIDSPFSTDKLLPQADFKDIIPPSVIEDTTKHLQQKSS